MDGVSTTVCKNVVVCNGVAAKRSTQASAYCQTAPVQWFPRVSCIVSFLTFSAWRTCIRFVRCKGVDLLLTSPSSSSSSLVLWFFEAPASHVHVVLGRGRLYL